MKVYNAYRLEPGQLPFVDFDLHWLQIQNSVQFKPQWLHYTLFFIRTKLKSIISKGEAVEK